MDERRPAHEQVDGLSPHHLLPQEGAHVGPFSELSGRKTVGGPVRVQRVLDAHADAITVAEAAGALNREITLSFSSQLKKGLLMNPLEGDTNKFSLRAF